MRHFPGIETDHRILPLDNNAIVNEGLNSDNYLTRRLATIAADETDRDKSLETALEDNGIHSEEDLQDILDRLEAFEQIGDDFAGNENPERLREYLADVDAAAGRADLCSWADIPGALDAYARFEEITADHLNSVDPEKLAAHFESDQ